MKFLVFLLVVGSAIYIGTHFNTVKYYANNMSRSITGKYFRNVPDNFAAASTREGYKTDITADELIQLARKENYSVAQIRNMIKGTPWEKSELVNNAIQKYYKSNKTSADSETPVYQYEEDADEIEEISFEPVKNIAEDLIEQVSGYTKTNPLNGVYNKNNDSFFEKKDELKINLDDDGGTLTYKDRDMVTIVYKIKLSGTRIIDSEYYFDNNLISSKKQDYLYVDGDKEIMERFKKYANHKGIKVKNPLFD